MTGTEVCRRCIVKGRVQGVFFRASTRQKAAELKLRGHARNLADGSVEVLACGAPGNVDALVDWLWQGPRMARVDAVEVEELDAAQVEIPAGFQAR